MINLLGLLYKLNNNLSELEQLTDCLDQSCSSSGYESSTVVPISSLLSQLSTESSPQADMLIFSDMNDTTEDSNQTLPEAPIHRPLSELILGTMTFLVIMAMIITGNILVILSIFTHRPLKKVQNYFLVSLASSDLAVAVLVMPFNIVKFIAGEWIFGAIFCQMWLTCDILCCTASILNLCAIAIDRYWAIHSPIEYASKRTLKLVLTMISAVWVLSCVIAIPPLVGWNDWSKVTLSTECMLTDDKAFVLFSASGSFFIPLIVMTTIYIKIFIAARARLKANKAKSGTYRFKNIEKTRVGEDPASPTSKRLIPASPEDNNGGDAETTMAITNHDKHLRLPDLGRRPQDSGFTDGTSVCENSPLMNRGSLTSHHQEKYSKTDNDRKLSVLSNTEEEGNQHCNGSGKTSKSSVFNKTSTFRAGSRRTMQSIRRPRDAVRSLFVKKEKISVSKEKKAAKTLAIIMGVFVLCWLPFFLMYVILPFCSTCDLHVKLAEAITWLGYVNSAINPVIYTIFNLDFRAAFHKLLCSPRRGY